MTVKPLLWVGSSLDDVRAFPPEARRIAGHQLDRIQQGKVPDDWKSMASVGTGVYELRVRTAVEHRVFYMVKFRKRSTCCTRFRSEVNERDRARSPWQRNDLSNCCGFVVRNAKSKDPEVNTMSFKLTKSSGNVFEDLGFPPEEADNLKIRSDLMIHVINVIESRGLTQQEAADLLRVTQPRVSDLVRGKIDLFSIDMLVKMLAYAGVHVSLTVEPEIRGVA
jgi:predicted XRE-type DNA-binding protein/phage-related protein